MAARSVKARHPTGASRTVISLLAGSSIDVLAARPEQTTAPKREPAFAYSSPPTACPRGAQGYHGMGRSRAKNGARETRISACKRSQRSVIAGSSRREFAPIHHASTGTASGIGWRSRLDQLPVWEQRINWNHVSCPCASHKRRDVGLATNQSGHAARRNQTTNRGRRISAG